MATGLAIVAGSGLLPRLLAEHCRAEGRDCVLVRFAGTVLDWADGYRVIDAEFEKPGRLFRDMRQAGCGEVCFAGGMQRPGLQVLKLDLKGLKLVGRMLAALASGDDAALRTISDQFEAEGFRVVAAHRDSDWAAGDKGCLEQGAAGQG